MADEALRASVKVGADQAEAFVTETHILLGQFSERHYSEITERTIKGLGVRVTKDQGVGFASTSKGDVESIRVTVNKAYEIAKTVKLPLKMTFSDIQKPSVVTGLFDAKIEEMDTFEIANAMNIMKHSAMEYRTSIQNVSGNIRTGSQKILIMNTNGLTVSDSEAFFESFLSIQAERGTRTSEGFDSTGGRSWSSFLPENMARNAAEMAVQGLSAVKIRDDEYTMILHYEPVAEITAFLNVLSSSLMSRLYLPDFRGKDQVASEKFSFYDFQNKPASFCACTFDDEGTPSRKIPVIEKGRLVNFIYDKLNSLFEEEQLTGGANRNPLKYPLMSSVRNVTFGLVPRRNYAVPPDPIGLNPCIEAGDESIGEMIKETPDGLLVKMFHYPTRSVEDFSAILRMGVSRIKNGEVDVAVKSCRLIGNLIDMLKDVDMISSEQRVSGSWFSGLNEAPAIRTRARVISLA